MSRPKGSRNAGHAQRRAALVARLRSRLADRASGQPSLRELAAAAEVTVPTLNHHFGGRDDIVAAVLEHSHEEGKEHIALAAKPVGLFAASVRQLLEYAAFGHRVGVSELHTIGFTEGLGHSRLGPTYVDTILEPTLQAVEARLTAHVVSGEMREADVRHAALSLLTPLLVAQLHQDDLGGSRCRPLDLNAFINDHADSFVRAFGRGQA